MNRIELALLSLGEATAIELHRDRDSQGFGELKRDAKDAGTSLGRARQVIEQDLGRPVVSAQNYRALKRPAVASNPMRPRNSACSARLRRFWNVIPCARGG
jgi:hypothetical protein